MNNLFAFNNYKVFEEKELTFLYKEPKYLELFRKMLSDGKTENELKELYLNIVRKRNTLKSRDIDLTKLNTYEDVYDKLQRMDLIERANKYIKLLPAHLRGDIKEDENTFADIIIDYDNYEDYKNVFLAKSNKYRTKEDFIKALKKHINSFTSASKILEEVKNTKGAIIIKSTPEYLVVYVKDYESCEKLGSSQWCIVTSRNTFNEYTRISFGKQYIIWDFEYEPTDKQSMVGVTMYKDRQIDAHLKNDNSAVSYVKLKEWYEYLEPYSKSDIMDMLNSEVALAIKKEYVNITDIPYEKQKSILREDPRVINYIPNDNISLFKKLSKEVDYKVLDNSKKLLYKKINRTPAEVKHDKNVDVYVFLAKPDFKEDANNKYIKTIKVEKFVKIDPYDMDSHRKMNLMLNRAKAQGDLNLYRIIVVKDFLDGEDGMNDMRDDPALLMSIEEKMERLG